MRHLATTAAFLAALAAAHPAAADRPGVDNTPHMADSLCQAPETALFSCRIGTRVVSICAQPEGEQARGEQAQGGAVYRFGRPGRIELQATGLHYAEHGFAGGGETQVYADTPTHRYVVFDGIMRTAFGADGLHYPQPYSGLFVQHGGTIVSSRFCAEETTFSPLAEKLLPTGDYMLHDIPRSVLFPSARRRPQRR